MIKILFFIESLTGGGAEKVLCDLVNAMDQSKFEITVQTLWKADAGQILKPSIRYRYCYPKKSSLYRYRNRIEAAARLTYPVHIKDDYDIEVAFLESGPTKILATSSNKHSAKIAWVHSDLLKYTTNPEQFAKKCSAWYEKYDRIVCVSETAKKSFDQVFSCRFPSTVIYNYIDDEAIRWKAAEPISIRKPVNKLLLMAVGTLYPPKNYPRLLKDYQKIKQNNTNLELWILGDGPQKEELLHMTKELQIDDSVKFLGFQKNPYPYVQLADVIVCSSNYEGFSTVITESLILGKTIVTTECSGMRELLGDSEFGIITENSDGGFLLGLKEVVEKRHVRECYAERSMQKGKTIAGECLLGQIEQFFTSIYSERVLVSKQ